MPPVKIESLVDEEIGHRADLNPAVVKNLVRVAIEGDPDLCRMLTLPGEGDQLGTAMDWVVDERKIPHFRGLIREVIERDSADSLGR